MSYDPPFTPGGEWDLEALYDDRVVVANLSDRPSAADAPDDALYLARDQGTRGVLYRNDASGGWVVVVDESQYYDGTALTADVNNSTTETDELTGGVTGNTSVTGLVGPGLEIASNTVRVLSSIWDGTNIVADVDNSAVTTDEAVINGGQVYVQDTRPTTLSAGDRWLAPGIIDAVGDPHVRYPLNEGAGVSVLDEAGDEDGTIQGASWTTGDWVGGQALSGDGASDYADLTTLASLGANLGGPLTMAFTVQTTDTSGVVFGVSDSEQALYTSIGTLTASDGAILLFVRERNSQNTFTEASTDSTYNDGNKHRVVLSYSDASSPSNWTFAVDGTTVSHTVHNDATLSTFTDFTRPPTLLAYNDDGSLGRYLEATIDNLQIELSSWGSTEIVTDYDRQPWT